MATDETPAGTMRHSGHAFIPAGIFIGLGVGILLDHVVPGVLIGLGLGFLLSSFISRHEQPGGLPGSIPCCGFMGRDWMPVMFGIFLILVGSGLVWAPLMVWPYLFAAFLILLGIGFVLRGFRN